MKLENERLRVAFAAPEELCTQRFDHTAQVSEVILDGKYAFCTPEQVLPGRVTTEGRGLCGEFVLAEAAEAAKAGQWFCKPGVGLLKQLADGAPYDMWKSYECRPFRVTAELTSDRAVFRQAAIPGSYAVDVGKVFTLEENRLILDITLTNSGEKACFVQEYQHNFVSLEGKAIDRGYILDLACDRTLAQIEGSTLRQGDEIRLPSAVAASENRVVWEKEMTGKVLYHRSGDIDPGKPYRWTLRHTHSPASVTEETDFCPTRIDIWAVEHCVCTEFYNACAIAPGEQAHWRRTWRFED